MSRGRLPEATVGLFRRVADTLDNDDEEDIGEEFLTNVFAKINTNELKLSRDKVVGCVLEKLLRAAPPIYVCQFVRNAAECAERFVSDKYASHVIQTALSQCLRMNEAELTETYGEGDAAGSLCDAVSKIHQVVLAKLNDFVFDVYGSHVVCALIQVMSGVRVSDDITRSRVSRKVAQKKTGGGQAKPSSASAEVALSPLPEEFSKQLDAFCSAFTSMRDFSHCLTDLSASKVLQTLLYCTQKQVENTCKYLCRQVLVACKVLPLQGEAVSTEASSGGAAISRLAEDAVASHGLECILSVASPKLVQRMCQQCFSGQLLAMALHPSGNFVVQKLCGVITTNAQMATIAGEILQSLEDILAVSHFGIPVALVNAAARLKSHQDSVVDAIMSAFHCTEDSSQFCRALLALCALEALDEEAAGGSTSSSGGHGKEAGPVPLAIVAQGCMLVAALFSLTEPTAVLDSFLSLSSADLVSLATEQGSGSRVFEAFLSCPGASSKLKRKLVKKLKGQFVHLACHKQGSFVVDACFKNTKAKSRRDIAEELLSSELVLRESFIGRHVLRNCDIDSYKLEKATMKSKALSKKRLFADVVDACEDSVAPRKKKKLF